MPMERRTLQLGTRMPALRRASRHAVTCSYTLSTRVPSRSNRMTGPGVFFALLGRRTLGQHNLVLFYWRKVHPLSDPSKQEGAAPVSKPPFRILRRCSCCSGRLVLRGACIHHRFANLRQLGVSFLLLIESFLQRTDCALKAQTSSKCNQRSVQGDFVMLD